MATARRQRSKDQSSPRDESQTVISSIGSFQGVAYPFIIVVFGAAAAIPGSGFPEMWAFPPKDGLPIFIVRLVFWLVIVVLAVRWVLATHKELELWLRKLHYAPPKPDVYLAIFGLSIVLGVSLALTQKAVFISGFTAFYLLFQYWTQWLANDQFERALTETTKIHHMKEEREILEAMREYWSQTPQLGRITIMMFVACIAFGIALAGHFQPDVQRSEFQFWAYVILTLDIVIGEIVIFFWRRSRDEAILNAEEQLRNKHEHRDR